MQTAKQCNNECRIGWCCGIEFYTQPISRFDKAAVELNALKGIEVRRLPVGHPVYFSQVIVSVPVKCVHMAVDGCNAGDNKPQMCIDFPTEDYCNWVLHKDCKYFREDCHWSWEDLPLHKPEI